MIGGINMSKFCPVDRAHLLGYTHDDTSEFCFKCGSKLEGFADYHICKESGMRYRVRGDFIECPYCGEVLVDKKYIHECPKLNKKIILLENYCRSCGMKRK